MRFNRTDWRERWCVRVGLARHDAMWGVTNQPDRLYHTSCTGSQETSAIEPRIPLTVQYTLTGTCCLRPLTLCETLFTNRSGIFIYWAQFSDFNEEILLDILLDLCLFVF